MSDEAGGKAGGARAGLFAMVAAILSGGLPGATQKGAGSRGGSSRGGGGGKSKTRFRHRRGLLKRRPGKSHKRRPGYKR